jgi:hypothetical protein
MDRALRIVLPALALLLLAAHFYRGAHYAPAGISFALVALLFVSAPWAGRLLRALLLLGSLEWLRTAWLLAADRAETGQPFLRMIVILGAVAAVTIVAALLAGRSRTDGGTPRGLV